jgi:hypothetical protein
MTRAILACLGALGGNVAALSITPPSASEMVEIWLVGEPGWGELVVVEPSSERATDGLRGIGA